MKSTSEIVKETIESVVYIKSPQLAGFMEKKGIWSSSSCLKKSSANLNKLAREGFLKKVGQRKSAYYMRKGALGNGDHHALEKSEQILQVLLAHPTAQILREPVLPFNRKPDVAIFIDEGKCQFFFLELERKNSIGYIEGKIKDYRENQVAVKKWFEETFSTQTNNFCFHLLFITTKRIEERPGVLVRRNFEEEI